MNKVFIDANQLLDDAFLLAESVYNSGYRPDFIIGVWRGGAPIGIAVHEFFDVCGVATDHIAIRASSYSGIAEQKNEVKIYGMEYLIDNVRKDDKVLFVDDVFDSGRSIEAILTKLKISMHENMPSQIKVACLYYKPKRNVTLQKPDYFLHLTDDWLVFPHELIGLTDKEIREGKSMNVAEAFARVKGSAPKG